MATSLFEQGLAVRKAVLGDEYVEASIKNADDFNRPLQELVTEYCWGAVWTREGLPRKTRSLLNLAMLATLNRPHELELHLRGALRNGCTKEEIREVLLQVAIYAGVPAAVDSFRTRARSWPKKRPSRSCHPIVEHCLGRDERSVLRRMVNVSTRASGGLRFANPPYADSPSSRVRLEFSRLARSQTASAGERS